MNKEFTIRLEKIEQALNKALQLEITQQWQDSSFGQLPSAVTKEHLLKLIEPNKNLIDLGGKRWRPLLLILCYEMASQLRTNQKTKENRCLSEEDAYSLVPLVEFVHTASLIHDDIEDSADFRRGKPACHITYGIDTALNSASWLYFEALVCINQLNTTDEFKLQLYKVYTNELRKLHLGQAMDIFWHRNPKLFPSQDEYEAMVKNKTGTLASLASVIGCISGGMPYDKALEFGQIAANIGIGFQIIDDVINLTTGNVGKKRGDDIVEGKKSLPVLMHIKEYPADKEIISNLMEQAGKEGINSNAVEECIKLLEKSDCIKHAGEKGVKLIKENCSKLNSDFINELFISMVPEAFR